MRKLKVSFVFLIILLCSGCSVLEIFSWCNHEYTVESVTAPTCSKEGLQVEICSLCEHRKETVIPKLPHTYESEIVSPTCEEKGYTLKTCSVCNETEKTDFVDALGHSFGTWETVVSPTETTDGLQQRECDTCGFKESKIISVNHYASLDVIKEEFNESVKYSFDSYDALLLKFSAAILNQSNKLDCNLNFAYGDFNSLLNNLVNDCMVPFNFHVEASLLGDNLTLTLSYSSEPHLSTKETIAYTQYNSLNYQPITKQRSDDFDDFAINKSLYQYKASTTDQLCYVLERGVLPICKEDSSAFVIYNKMKEVLRNIVTDDMADVEKIKAIHDYLVMNVTYDNDLLVLLSNGTSNIKEYYGFYLEGVFNDNEAVCEGISKAFMAMCNIEGIPCVFVEGYDTKNPSGVGHAWNKVYVDGAWYIVDVTSDGTIINNQFEVLSYKYFLIDEVTYSKEYTGNTYTNIECNKKIDIYELSKFNGFDLKIDSQEELNKLVAYFNKGDNKKYTFEFELAFDFGESCLDEIKAAYNANSIVATYSYIDNGNIFMLIKQE